MEKKYSYSRIEREFWQPELHVYNIFYYNKNLLKNKERSNEGFPVYFFEESIMGIVGIFSYNQDLHNIHLHLTTDINEKPRLKKETIEDLMINIKDNIGFNILGRDSQEKIIYFIKNLNDELVMCYDS